MAEFFQQSWHVLEPSTDLLWNWHLEAICYHAQEIFLDWLRHREDSTYQQRSRNLLINVPPGSAKSRIISVCLPAWIWTRHPSFKMIFLSANPTVALRDSVLCRDLIESDWYRETFAPDWQLRGDQNSKSSYWNTASGFRNAAGFNSRITGARADCLDASTVVATENGDKTIKEIFEAATPIKVWSFNHTTGSVELKPVTAARKVLARNSVRVITGDGKEIKCTHDHRIFTGSGYVAADSLQAGMSVRTAQIKRREKMPPVLVQFESENSSSELWSLRKGDTSTSVRRDESKEVWAEECLLFEAVPVSSNKPIAAKACLQMSNLQCGNEGSQWPQVLHEGVHSKAIANDDNLQMVRTRVQVFQQETGVVQSQMRFCGAFSQDDWIWKFSLQDGDELCTVVRLNASDNLGEGWRVLRGVRKGGRQGDDKERSKSIGSIYSSHQSRSNRQCCGESDYDVPEVSCHSSRLDSDTISRLEFDCNISEYVYDIQVEGNCNFFANEILVHNCLIWDDPHDAGQVESEALRLNVTERWDSAIRNRVNDPRSSIRVGIMQRLHAEDLSGHVLQTGEWDLLCIPQEFEEAQPPTAIGWVDPRTEPGELMFPDRFSEEFVKQERLLLGSYGYAGQHQQRPSPAAGGMFQRGWWQFYKVAPNGFDRVIQSWDCTFKDAKTSDFVVGQVWGKSGSEYYLLDQVRDRMDINATLTAIRSLSAKWPQAKAKLVEDKANGSAVIDLLKREISGLIAINPQGGKVVRATAIAPYIEAGNVYLPDPSIAPWVHDLVEEFSSFPNGANDDQVDGASQAIAWLENNTAAPARRYTVTSARNW